MDKKEVKVDKRFFILNNGAWVFSILNFQFSIIICVHNYSYI